MSKKGKAIVAISSVLLVILIVWAVTNIPNGPQNEPAPLDQRVVSFDGNTISQEKDGRILWTIKAEDIEMDIDTKNASLTNVKATFNFEDGRTVELTAPKATYEDKTHQLIVVNGVAGKSSDGGKFSCQEVEWLPAEDTLAMKGDARLEYEKEHVKATADRIESSNGFKKFKAVGGAHFEKGN